MSLDVLVHLLQLVRILFDRKVRYQPDDLSKIVNDCANVEELHFGSLKLELDHFQSRSLGFEFRSVWFTTYVVRLGSREKLEDLESAAMTHMLRKVCAARTQDSIALIPAN